MEVFPQYKSGKSRTVRDCRISRSGCTKNNRRFSGISGNPGKWNAAFAIRLFFVSSCGESYRGYDFKPILFVGVSGGGDAGNQNERGRLYSDRVWRNSWNAVVCQLSASGGCRGYFVRKHAQGRIRQILHGREKYSECGLEGLRHLDKIWKVDTGVAVLQLLFDNMRFRVELRAFHGTGNRRSDQSAESCSCSIRVRQVPGQH